MKRFKPAWAQKAISVITASALALSITAAPAFAAVGDGYSAANASFSTQAAMAIGGKTGTTNWTYVTASNSPASQAAPEILGISGIDELQEKVADIPVKYASNEASDKSYVVKNYLKYIFMGLSEYNSNPNPYYGNTLLGESTTNKVVDNTDKRQKGIDGASSISNPNRALAPYGSVDTTDTAVWEMYPDIIVGTQGVSGAVNYDTDTGYAEAVRKSAKAQADGMEDYHPSGVEYKDKTMGEVVDSTYNIASTADDIVDNSNGTKKLRYGVTATSIAQNYERYVKGIQGYIMQKIDNGDITKKTVAVVTGAKNADGTYNLAAVPENAHVAANWSTANRFTEIIAQVADNYGGQTGGSVKATATADELKSAAVDLIVFANPTLDDNGAITGVDVSQEDSAILAKAYWYDDKDTGAIYKVNANSVEVGTNYGRILGCLYPDVFKQRELVAYYYETFYHISTGVRDKAIDEGMDGIRCWEATGSTSSQLATWSASSTESYSWQSVQDRLNEGIAYLKTKTASAADTDMVKLLTPTPYIDIQRASLIDLSSAAVTLPQASYPATGSAIIPDVTVKLGNKTLTKGTEYELSATNNINPGTATLKVQGIGAYTGSVLVNFTIVQASSSDKVVNYRLYNKYSGEHLFTLNKSEYEDLAKLGWTKEGTGWVSPAKSNTPVYRLYNKYSGDHHYTTDKKEYDKCVKAGWTGENVGFYSDDNKNVPVYRLFNRYVTVGTHHYTTGKSEYDKLGKIGWKKEGEGCWYAVSLS